jgi:hypothetical protein
LREPGTTEAAELLRIGGLSAEEVTEINSHACRVFPDPSAIQTRGLHLSAVLVARHHMKNLTPVTVRISAALSICTVALFTTACEVKKTQEGEMPKVSVEGGQAPKYDVDAADVTVGQKEKTITVPDVTITTPSEKRAENAAPSTPAAPAAPNP